MGGEEGRKSVLYTGRKREREKEIRVKRKGEGGRK